MRVSIRDVARRFLRRLGYEITRAQPQCRARALNVLPLVVADLIRQKADRGDRTFFVVQIGAHDGVRDDPLRQLIVEHHWRGVLVGPQPRVFRRLVENYEGEPQHSFENAPIAERDGSATLYTLRTAAREAHLTMVASFDRSTVERVGRRYGADLEQVVVPTLTVESLVANTGSPLSTWYRSTRRVMTTALSRCSFVRTSARRSFTSRPAR